MPQQMVSLRMLVIYIAANCREIDCQLKNRTVYPVRSIFSVLT